MAGLANLSGCASKGYGTLSDDFFDLIPGPPPFSAMNSTPAASSAVRMAATVRG